MKKIYKMLIIFALTFLFIPLTSCAQIPLKVKVDEYVLDEKKNEYVYMGVDRYYDMSYQYYTDGEATVKSVEILSEYKGKPVTKIYDRAFFGNKIIEEVIIPSSIKEIGEEAFWGCRNLKSVELNEGLEVIGGNAFRDTSIKTIKLPKTVKTIEQRAFMSCERMHFIELNEGLEKIGEDAFMLSGLVSIVIPKSVKEVGDYILSSNEQLKEVINLSDVKLFLDSSASVTHAYDQDGSYLNLLLMHYSNSLDDRAEFVEINDCIFMSYCDECYLVSCDICDNSKDLKLDFSVTFGAKTYDNYIISEYAFAYSSLHSVSLKNVKRTKSGAFDFCTWGNDYGIEDIYFYKGIESIHNYSVYEIYGHKFYLHFEGTEEDWKDILPQKFYELKNTVITFEAFD